MGNEELSRAIGRVEGILEEVTRQLSTISERLDDNDRKLESVVKLETTLTDFCQKTDEHEKRLDEIDTLKNKGLGIVAALSVFGSAITDWIQHNIFGK